jgi:hypothetical protein
LFALALLSCGHDEKGSPSVPVDQACVSDSVFFSDQVQSIVLNPVCSTCHTRAGAAHTSSFILENSARPDFLEVNQETLANLAGLERDGTSIVLLKPLGGEGHGGGSVLAEDSEEYAILTEFVSRLDNPVESCPNEQEPDWGAGLTLISPEQTVRKASLLLVGRLPTATEQATVADGGEEALRQVLRGQMNEEAFIERMQELYNDVLLTDAFLGAYDGVTLLDYDQYPSRYWFEDAEPDLESVRRSATSRSIAREPLELLAHILREDLPYTEILTADYTMVNDYSALSYGVAGIEWPDPADATSHTFFPHQLTGIRHAGVLTSPAFLNRYPTTESNRNRHRTWAFMKAFMATDLLQFADRPIDLTASDTHNPTLNDPQCNICHAVMDPMAGLFQNWDGDGAFNPLPNGWYTEMAVPGFENMTLPTGEQGGALGWMSQQVVKDHRFAISAVQTVLSGLTGLELLSATATLEGDDMAEAYAAQQAFVTETATAFSAGGFDLKFVVEAVLVSRYFRAVGDASATPGDLVQAGTAHLLTPAELNRKLLATTGFHWESWDGDYLTNRYQLLYGGIDSDGITRRLTDPNGIMASVLQRMGTEVGCSASTRDFLLPAQQRRLFPFVEPGYVPTTPEGFDIPEPEAAIRQNIVYLHQHLLGETLDINDPEIEITYQLWVDTWQDGVAAIDAGDEYTWITWQCTSSTWGGTTIPSELFTNSDPNYTVRAWAVVLTYLISDYRFAYE